MNIIQITGNQPGCGKSSIIGALALMLRDKEKRVGYYKPFSIDDKDDRDTKFIAGELLGQTTLLSPALTPLGTLDGQDAQTIKANVQGLQSSCDTLLIEGPGIIVNGTPSTLTHEVSKLIGSKLVLMHRWDKNTAASIQSENNGYTGIIVNIYPPHRTNQTATMIIASTSSPDCPIIGAIPDDRDMLSVTIQQITDHLQGTWFEDPETPETPRQLIKRFLIGGNIMDSGPNYFCRHDNQAVIARADRPDIHMASFKGNTKCVVMTGGGTPTEYVQIEARNLGIPLIMVNEGTIDTAHSLEGLLASSTCHSTQKINRFRSLVESHLDANILTNLLA
jgi:BioD-like phosphotransacetylase family protein